MLIFLYWFLRSLGGISKQKKNICILNIFRYLTMGHYWDRSCILISFLKQLFLIFLLLNSLLSLINSLRIDLILHMKTSYLLVWQNIFNILLIPLHLHFHFEIWFRKCHLLKKNVTFRKWRLTRTKYSFLKRALLLKHRTLKGWRGRRM